MADKPGLAPYYFPTTVVFIDDDESFLANLSLSMPGDLAFRAYTQPLKALNHIQEVAADRPLHQRCFGPPSGTRDPASAEIELDLAPIAEAPYAEQRFSEISVVVIDYDMPGVNGLEVCSQLNHIPIKKVLLTGQASASVAIDAFNQGLIDYFIPKSAPDIAGRLQLIIQRLQLDYFHKVSGPITRALGPTACAFLSDPHFVTHFEQLARQHAWVEHYLSSAPAGLLCLDAKAQTTLMMVANREQLGHHANLARQQGAPGEIANLIERGEVLANPYSNDDPRPRDWRASISLAQQVPKAPQWVLALVQQPSHMRISPKQLLNYHYYLEILDYLAQTDGNAHPSA